MHFISEYDDCAVAKIAKHRRTVNSKRKEANEQQKRVGIFRRQALDKTYLKCVVLTTLAARVQCVEEKIDSGKFH